MGGRRQNGGPGNSSSGSNSRNGRQPQGRSVTTPRARTFAEATTLPPRKALPPSGEAPSSPTSTQSTPPGLGFQQPLPRPQTAANGVLATPRNGRGSATPRGGATRPTTPATLPLLNLPHARQAFHGSGPVTEPARGAKEVATPRGGVSIPLLRLGGGDGAAVMPSPRNNTGGAQHASQQRRPMRTPRGRGGRLSNSGGGAAAAPDRSAAERPASSHSTDGQGGRIGSKRGPQHNDSESNRLEQEALRKRGAAWKQHQQGETAVDTATAIQQEQQENSSLQVKVAEAREASGSELPGALRAAVADNERLNKQLHMLHGSATQLRQAIADARSLQMHLQQEAADARLLAVGLQAQLRDAEAHAVEAQADRASVRDAALQLVRDTAALFQLTATEVFGDAAISFAQQEAGGAKRHAADTLDSKSFSLVQNAQALLAPGDGDLQVSGSSSQNTSYPPGLQQAHGSVAAQNSARLALPGKNGRTSSDPPSGSRSPARPLQQQHSAGKGQQQRQTPNATQHPQRKDATPSAAPPHGSSSSGDSSVAASRLAQRIASMHEKFAAATNLLDTGASNGITAGGV